MRSKLELIELLQALGDALLHALLEELHVRRAVVEHRLEDGLEEALRQVRVVVEVREGDFRLNHPELGQVARGVGVLRPEGGAEGVDLATSPGSTPPR